MHHPLDDARARLFARFVVEHVSDPVLVLDGDGAVRSTNHAVSPELVAFFDGASASPEVHALLARLRQDGRANGELARPLPDGRTSHLRVEGALVEQHAVIIARDVSTEREASDELRVLRRVEALGAVATSVVHDVNNLLTPVLLLSGHLARHLDGSAWAELARHIESAAHRASVLARDVLAFARPGRARWTPVDVSRVMLELRPFVERLAGEAVDVALELSPGLDPVTLDRTALENAVLNLVANARDAMPNGGRLTIQSVADPASRSIALQVRDTGIGMSEHVRARAFDRFFTTKGHGNGLGLASVRRFADEAGATIDVESAPGRGTTVTLRLPCVPHAADDAARAEAVRGRETVLIVEADGQIRRALAYVLEAAGYGVVEADGPDSALAALADASISLALVDARLASPSAALARALSERPTRVLVMIGDHGSARGVVPGAPTLHKAFSEPDLLRVVRAALDVAR
ncbi:Sensory box histidine kinase/response regulator [Sandaracinus amylolyticus]|uniref:histidine kinase n=2 Tax=Sandaracinus amylolyticus TaxID=927083 RepID=A0A0F6W0B8_9BACT|nr:Sensory box histidine kinase/response regulator [Sandaracinus amylolyticus]